MEIYYKDEDGKLQETTLFALLHREFERTDMKVDIGSFSDGSCDWTGLIQEKDNNQVTTNVLFEKDGNTIRGVTVHSAPIRRVVDEENSKKII